MGISVSAAYDWLKAHDLPNWVTFAFTAVVWPLVIFGWQRRRVNGIPGLEVSFYPGTIKINAQSFDAIDIRFTNHTGSVVYISRPRIRNCSKRNYPVPAQAARDIAGNSYHLKFNDGAGGFTLREVTLQTTATAQTCMPAFSAASVNALLPYVPPLWARVLRRRKFFVLEYTAMVGTKPRAVATVY